MKRKIAFGGVLVIAAALALFNLFLTMVGLMMRPSGGGIDDALWASTVAAVVITAVALLLLVRSNIAAYWFAVFAAVVVAVSFVPRLVYAVRQQASEASQQAEKWRIDKLVSDRIVRRTKDVETRIAERRPYTPQEAFDFLFTVSSSDLRYQGTGDHSEAALAMFRRALSEKIIDPNAIAQGVHPLNKQPEPLFLLYYRGFVKRPGDREIMALHWTMMTLFAEHGADLTLPAAASLAEDLRKTATPVGDGRAIELK